MDSVTVYQRKDGKWAWQRQSENGEVVATDAGQGYEDKSMALHMAEQVNGDIPVTIEEPKA